MIHIEGRGIMKSSKISVKSQHAYSGGNLSWKWLTMWWDQRHCELVNQPFSVKTSNVNRKQSSLYRAPMHYLALLYQWTSSLIHQVEPVHFISYSEMDAWFPKTFLCIAAGYAVHVDVFMIMASLNLKMDIRYHTFTINSIFTIM